MPRRTSTLLGDERGATAIEYGLIVSLIVIGMLTALIQLAGRNSIMWGDVANRVTSSQERAAAKAN